jgi:hypothetical protein
MFSKLIRKKNMNVYDVFYKKRFLLRARAKNNEMALSRAMKSKRKELENERNPIKELKAFLVPKRPAIKKIFIKNPAAKELEEMPNFHITGSVRGMRKYCYGYYSLLVRCGSYIYNVGQKPELYYFFTN